MNETFISLLTKISARKLILASAIGLWLGASITSVLFQLAALDAADQKEAEHISKNILHPIAFLTFTNPENTPLIDGLINLAGRQPGVKRIHLIQGDGNIILSTQKLETGRLFIDPEIWHDNTQTPKVVITQLNSLRPNEIIIQRLDDKEKYVAIQRTGEAEKFLVLEYDHSHNAALSYTAIRNDFVIEAIFLLIFPVSFYWFFDRIWLKRKRKIIYTLERLGDGELGAQSHVTGQDELGKIGTAVDNMSLHLLDSELQLRRLQLLVDSSHVALLEIENDGNATIRFASEAVSLWGYSPGELIYGKKTFFQIIHPDSIANFAEIISTSAKKQVFPKTEFVKIFNQQGEVRQTLIQLSDISYRSNVETGLALAITDITDDIEKDAALKTQNEQLSHFFNLPFIGMIVANASDKLVTQCNAYAASIFGLTQSEVISTKIDDLLNPLGAANASHESKADLFLDTINFKATVNNPIKGIIRVKVQSSIFDIDTQHTDSRANRQTVFITIQEDTSQESLEESLLQIHRQVDLIENLAEAGSWAFDSSTDSFEITPYCASLLGISPTKLCITSNELIERAKAEYTDSLNAFIEELRISQNECHTFFQTRTDEATTSFINASSHPSTIQIIRNSKVRLGTFSRLKNIDVIEESTNSSAFTELIELKTKALQEANTRLSAYSYSISHDLKSPLRIIDGYCELIRSDHSEALNSEGLRHLNQIQSGIRQMSQIITDLLEYSKFELTESVTSYFDPNKIVVGIVNLYSDCTPTNASITTAIESTTLHTDKAALDIIIRNLIDNGIKFSSKINHPMIEITGSSINEDYCLSFKDNGIGIDLKHRDQIFGLFQRLHRKEEYPGTGVGLAMVAVALGRIKGSISIDSAIGSGTTFSITFPKRLHA